LRPFYESVAAVVAGKGGVPWAVNGEPLRIDPRMRRFVAPTTEPELWKWLKAEVHTGEHILDVGAFLGVYAIMLARWAGPSSRVLAFEPTPGIADALGRHIVMNGLDDRIQVLRLALGASDGEAMIHQHSEPYRNAIGVTDPAGRETGQAHVVVSTIDAVCERHGFEPTLIRMDVQGSELAVLEGARRTIGRGRGRLRIVLEVHPQLWALHGTNAAAFEDLLNGLGLCARTLSQPDPAGFRADEHVELVYR
jgi:FkbM family methyltransferase